MRERGEALRAAVDLSPLHGAPEWVVRLLLSDFERFIETPVSRWQASDIQQLQESVNTLPARMLLAAMMDPATI